MTSMLLAFALMFAVVFAAGKWAEIKQRRLVAGPAAQPDQEVRHARPDR